MLYLGDCLDVLPTLPDKSVHLILADNPYGKLKKVGWDQVILIKPLFKQYKRLLTDGGVICLFASQPFTSLLIVRNLSWFKYEIIWNKKAGMGFQDAKHRVLKTHENLILFSNGGCSTGSKIRMTYNPQGLVATIKKRKTANGPSKILNDWKAYKQDPHVFTGYPKSIWEECRVQGNHETEKPVVLLEKLIRTYSNEGELVLDNAMGSGSTGVAAKNTGRLFIGIEKSEEKFKVAYQRLQ